jgi:hypothetical protein
MESVPLLCPPDESIVADALVRSGTNSRRKRSHHRADAAMAGCTLLARSRCLSDLSRGPALLPARYLFYR